MKEITCNIIRDLLPLYEDDVVSQDSAELVRDHLKNCPACREELRRMRAPVSLPPDTDAAMLSRFEERLRRIRRRTRLRLLCVGLAVALIAALCLWYTRPQSWDNLDGHEVTTSLTARYSKYSFDTGRPEILTWSLLELPPEDEASQAILNALHAGRYRASLLNLLPFPSHGQNGTEGSVNLFLVWDKEQYATVLLSSSGSVTISGTDQLRTYRADEDLYHTLSTLIQEYGVLNQS